MNDKNQKTTQENPRIPMRMRKVEKERLYRYQEKLELTKERIKDIRSWTKEKKTKTIVEDKKTRLAVFKAFQEIVESSMDICAMMLKDSEKIVREDYENLNKLKQLNILSVPTVKSLKEANGLRNRLIHEYNGLENRTAIKSLQNLLPRLEKFGSEVSKWLK